MREIWLASRSGGFHFKLIDEKWTCSKTGVELFEMVKQECVKHAGETIDWN
jgi:CyaY protein